MITLEKDKVYKAIHIGIWGRKRNYIIFSPLNDIMFDGQHSIKFETHFTVCFDGGIRTKYDSCPAITGFDSGCKLVGLNNRDLTDVRKTMVLLGNSHHYNRKLNKVIYGI